MVSAIEHIGSTSVPGLAAKPIIDLDVLLASAAYLPETIRRLATLGYEHEGDLGIAGREAFRTPPSLFAHHLYVCLPNYEEFRNTVTVELLFQDGRVMSSAEAKYPECRRSLSLDELRVVTFLYRPSTLASRPMVKHNLREIR